jgi:pyruvate dehydrogenase (quinone)/pyruvate oxidase
MLNGMAEAFSDKTPVLAITGQVETRKVGSAVKQYVQQQVLVHPLASFTAEPECADAAPKVLDRALLRAMNRRELVHISLPKDLLHQTVSGNPMPPVQGIRYAPVSLSERALSHVLLAMESSERPLILAGTGALTAMQEVRALAEKWGAGLITTLGAKGTIEREFPLNLYGLGQGGSEPATLLLQECDMLLVVGSNWWPEDYTPVVKRVVQIDDNPEALGNAPTPEIALLARTEEVLPLLNKSFASTPKPAWRDRIRVLKYEWDELLQAEVDQEDEVHPGLLMRSLSRLDLDQCVITVDTGDHTVWFNRHYHGRCKRVLFSGEWRTMGFALPAAIAASLIYPGKRVICLVGDGSLNMVLSELATLVREGSNVTVIVLKNGSLAMEKNRVLNAGLKPIGVDLPEIDYTGVAGACGLRASKVERVSQLGKALQQSVNTEGPVLLEVSVTSPMLPHTKL